jgi:hypothetical protein
MKNINGRFVENQGQGIGEWHRFRSRALPSGRTRHSAIFDNRKTEYNVETVAGRR